MADHYITYNLCLIDSLYGTLDPVDKLPMKTLGVQIKILSMSHCALISRQVQLNQHYYMCR